MDHGSHLRKFATDRALPLSPWRTLLAGAVAGLLWAGLSMGPAVGAETELRPHAAFPELKLKAHERGEDAIQALGARLPDVAKWYGRTPDEFKSILRGDRQARIDHAGRLYYVDEFPAETTTASGGTDTIAGALLPLDQTFKLHSRPGAQRTIYLDFDGYVASGTAWNASYGLTAIDSPAFDLDGNAASFSTSELERIQYIWQRVAEDYAPFDVDVTTEEPPAAALTRSGSGDLVFGTRVVITKDWTAGTSSPCRCGGFAYVGVFDDTTEYYKPAFVFYNQLGSGNEKYVAEAISHEAGHNLNLSHDGVTGGSAYYSGHGSGATGWAPIMGVGYYQSLVQWSKGEYSNANNTEDDIARIQSTGAPLRADDHGDTFATATPLTATAKGTTVDLLGDGVISTRTDVDVFSFSSGPGTISLSIDPAARSGNLDIQADLYDANGTLVASANPVDALNASISVSNANAGIYYLKIDGVGKGDLTTGYSDYGSLGQYVVTGSVPASSDQPPVAIASATPTSGTAPLTVSFNGSSSYDPDGGALTYSWNFGDGSALSSAANPSHTYTAAGNYTATLTVTDTSGASATTQAFIAVASSAPTVRVESIGMRLSVSSLGARAYATVTVTDGNGKLISGAAVKGNWSGVVSGSASGKTTGSGQANIASGRTTTRGTFTFTVTGITLTGYTYDPAQNKASSASIVY
jgi:PKD repeat protein